MRDTAGYVRNDFSGAGQTGWIPNRLFTIAAGGCEATQVIEKMGRGRREAIGFPNYSRSQPQEAVSDADSAPLRGVQTGRKGGRRENSASGPLWW